MLVLDVAEDFFDQILEGTDTAGAAELIDNHGERYFLLHQGLHQFLGVHAFGNDGYLADMFFPTVAIL